MSEDAEVIRQQMDETKAQLAEKLETLELQVAETVQSTGNVVSATVEAVQETVENVTGAVQDAVQSVNHAFDLRRQLDKHPWYVLGGSVALGFLAHELLGGKASKFKVSALSANNMAAGDGGSVNSPSTARPLVAATGTAGNKKSSWNELQELAMETIVGLVKEVAKQSVPQLVEAITGNRPAKDGPVQEDVRAEDVPQQGYTPVQESAEAARRLYVPGNERRQQGNSHSISITGERS